VRPENPNELVQDIKSNLKNFS